MSLPRSHTKTLQRDLQAHEQRLESLRQQIAHFAEEATMHENILKLGRDEGIMRVIDELSNKPQLAEELAADGSGYARGRGIELPDGAEVEVTSRGERTQVLIHLRHGDWEYSCGWDSEEGFSVAPIGSDGGNRNETSQSR